MIRVIFYENGKKISARDFVDKVTADEVNRYINENWKLSESWKLFKNEKRISFRSLFHKAFEFKKTIK